ncbi:MAG: hypothetical protein JEZ07_14645 [Phycisphaerae bacterium]|nr:hypothetical protein [Phycisphaerae bacterium]
MMHKKEIIQFISKTCYWSKLQQVTNSFIGKAVVVCSIVPYILKILDIFFIDRIIDTLPMVNSLRGALLFLVSYFFVILFSPKRIQTHKSQEDYVHWCLNEIDSITLVNEFHTLSLLSEKNHAYNIPEVKSAKNLGNLHELSRKGVKLTTATRTLAIAQYIIDDSSIFIIRFIFMFSLLFGAIMMFNSLISLTVNEVWS